jgi:hypothetical protein
MSEDVKLLFDVLEDYANGMEATAVRLKVELAKIQGVEPRKVWSWSPDRIRWAEAYGSKGKYERGEDVTSLDFKSLLKDLAQHNGFLLRDGFSYWSFKNGATVGRRRKK